MIRSEIRTEAMRLIAEKSTTSSYVVAADHNAFIDEGIKEMCEKAFVYILTKTGTIQNGIARYYCPSDYLRMVGLLRSDNTPLIPIEASEVGVRYITTGNPLYYYMSQLTGTWYFTLVDTPTTAGGGTGTYTITYNALDVALAGDGSSPNFPSSLHHYLVKYDAYKSFVKMKRPDLATPIYIDFCLGLGIPLPNQGAINASS